MVNEGLFIAFEGGEGCGKSTQILAAYQYLMDVGVGAVVTKQPGGTAMGKAIRSLLLDPRVFMCPEAETLLYLADRAHHINMVIKPALDMGQIVLCDRYHLSTLAYQCAARGINEKLVTQIFSEFCQGLTPDLTIWLDTDVSVALERATRKGGDRIEREPMSFHEKVYGFFAGIDQNENYVRIDGNKSVEKVKENVVKAIQRLLTLRNPSKDFRLHRGKF